LHFYFSSRFECTISCKLHTEHSTEAQKNQPKFTQPTRKNPVLTDREDSTEDETIIDLYFAREERAIAETGKKYGGYCRSIAFNILHSHEDTEECVSDTWLHTWNAIPPTRPGCLRAFLGRITRNLSFTRWEAARAQKRGGGQTELLLSELSDCLPGGERPEARLDAQAVTLTIEVFLQSQTRENRQLFLRRYYYGDSVRRLSGLFGLTENTVKSRLFRLRAGLRDALLKEGIAV